MHMPNTETKPGFFKPPQPRPITVRRTIRITEHLQRVIFTGDGLKGFPEGWESAHIKLLFKKEHQTQLTLPTLDPKGPIWPEDQALKPDVRVYSVRSYDAQNNELAVDFALHEQGVASTWARHAKPGDIVGLGGPGGYCPKPPASDYYLFAGDLSALSGMGGLLATLPTDAAGHAVILVPGPEDVFELDRPDNVRVSWLYGSETPGSEAKVVSEIQNLELPMRNLWAWLAGEQSLVVQVREHLKDRLGVTSQQMYATPFWKRGLDEDAYHDARHDVMHALEN
ncbi:MAG: NADPH-dependent ferric siderophore reductase [Phycisphaeraceae bacterium]|nr:NADPH-dependent ferric siderophore reductase [Phycisphaeraceae bacterium]